MADLLLAFGASGIPRSSLEASLALAAELTLPIRGLFVSEPSLPRLSALSWAQQLGATSGTDLPLSLGAVRLAVEAARVRLEREIARIAATAGVPFSAEQASGAMLETALVMLEEHPIVVLPPPGTRAGLLPTTEGSSLSPAAIVAQDGGTGADLMRIAAALESAYRRREVWNKRRASAFPPPSGTTVRVPHPVTARAFAQPLRHPRELHRQGIRWIVLAAGGDGYQETLLSDALRSGLGLVLVAEGFQMKDGSAGG